MLLLCIMNDPEFLKNLNFHSTLNIKYDLTLIEATFPSRVANFFAITHTHTHPHIYKSEYARHKG